MNWIQQFKQRVEQENPQPERIRQKPRPQGTVSALSGESLDPVAVVENSTPSSVATDRPEVSERKPTEPIQISESKPERFPGEDEAGIMGVWPPKAWSLADWVKGARGDFHVFDGLLGTKPISRGFSWRD